MTDPSKSLKELFLSVLEVAPQDRAVWLDRECAGDAGLRQQLDLMLAAHDAPHSLLDQPPLADSDATLGRPFSSTTQIGVYKLLQQIGEGGMGVVWMAEQSEPIRRRVALKVIKAGMDSRQVIARFDAERQALSLMDHPNIARVLDAGATAPTEDGYPGRPYFVMELVKGVPITKYCDDKRLGLRERLELFLPVCQAIQHAHQKGIIHRDVKPSNVLVALYDGRPVPKVIDFGVAKATVQKLTEKTMFTEFGQVIGTLEYMSPEQAELNQLDIDTRTDIYSLGVLLYELLTGTTPLQKAELRAAAFGEILRWIKEVEPPKPSTRVSTSDQLPKIAAQRNLDAKQLTRNIRGDLDWIVMKAIEKERDRRYETANGLARDIERFLNLEAVEACPPGSGYRLRRFARKHRAVLSAVAAIAATVVLALIVSTWQAVRATKAESLASTRLFALQSEQRKTQEALAASQQSERRARESQSAEATARKAEEAARVSEAEQRRQAELQRDEAKRLEQEAATKSNQLQLW